MTSTVLPLFIVAAMWGLSNPFIKKAAMGLNRLKNNPTYRRKTWAQRLIIDFTYMASTPSYLLPTIFNLIGSALFFRALSNSRVKDFRAGPRLYSC